MTNYPQAIDTIVELPTAIDNTTVISSDYLNRLRDAILAIESELGVKPSGILTTIRSRLDNIESSVETILGGDAFSAGGDLSGTIFTQIVIGLQGRPLSSSSPSVGNSLVWDGYTWAPTAISSEFTAGGDLSGNSSNQTVIKIQNIDVSTTDPLNNDILGFDGTSWTPTKINNNHIVSNASIDGTKINPNFGNQNIYTSGNIECNYYIGPSIASPVTGSNGIIHFSSSNSKWKLYNPSMSTHQDIVAPDSPVHGSIIYRNANEWVQLSPSTDGYVLTTHGTSANPTWEEVLGGGGGTEFGDVISSNDFSVVERIKQSYVQDEASVSNDNKTFVKETSYPTELSINDTYTWCLRRDSKDLIKVTPVTEFSFEKEVYPIDDDGIPKKYIFVDNYIFLITTKQIGFASTTSKLLKINKTTGKLISKTDPINYKFNNLTYVSLNDSIYITIDDDSVLCKFNPTDLTYSTVSSFENTNELYNDGNFLWLGSLGATIIKFDLSNDTVVNNMSLPEFGSILNFTYLENSGTPKLWISYVGSSTKAVRLDITSETLDVTGFELGHSSLNSDMKGYYIDSLDELQLLHTGSNKVYRINDPGGTPILTSRFNLINNVTSFVYRPIQESYHISFAGTDDYGDSDKICSYSTEFYFSNGINVGSKLVFKELNASGSAGGDLSSSYPNPNVVRLNGAKIRNSTSNKKGRVLQTVLGSEPGKAITNYSSTIFIPRGNTYDVCFDNMLDSYKLSTNYGKPKQLLFNEAENYLFIRTDSFILTFNTDDRKIVSSVNTTINDMTYDATQGYIWAIFSSNLYRINPYYEYETSYNLGFNANSILFLNDSIWVTGNDNVYKINKITGNIEDTIPTTSSGNIIHLASNFSDQFWIGNKDTGEIERIDTATSTIVDTYTIGGSPSTAAVSGTFGTLDMYIVTDDNNKLFEITDAFNTPTAGSIIDLKNTPTSVVYVVSDEEVHVVIDYDDIVEVYDANTFSKLREYSISGLIDWVKPFKNVKLISSSETVTNDDEFIGVTTSSTVTVTLPSSPGTGECFIIKDVTNNASVNNITVNGNGKQIDGNSTYIINTNNGNVTILYNGASWSVI